MLNENGLNCDVFVTLHGTVAYFFSFYHGNRIIRTNPLFVRTTYKPLVTKLENEMGNFLKQAITYDTFKRQFQDAELTPSEILEVEHMAANVKAFEEFLAKGPERPQNGQ